MLSETHIHHKYIQFLNSQKTKFEHGAKILNGTINFKVEFGGRVVGVEIKSNRSNPITTIGQLLNAKRTFSHVYLLSPKKFYEEIFKILQEVGLHEMFGYILFANNTFTTLSDPKIKNYYFHQEYYKPTESKQTKILVMDENITRFLKKHQNKHFMCSDIAKDMSITMPHAQTKIYHWKRFGLIEEVPERGYPKAFRVLKIPKEEYVYL